jgi:hypothetical protein
MKQNMKRHREVNAIPRHIGPEDIAKSEIGKLPGSKYTHTVGGKVYIYRVTSRGFHEIVSELPKL